MCKRASGIRRPNVLRRIYCRFLPVVLVSCEHQSPYLAGVAGMRKRPSGSRMSLTATMRRGAQTACCLVHRCASVVVSCQQQSRSPGRCRSRCARGPLAVAGPSLPRWGAAPRPFCCPARGPAAARSRWRGLMPRRRRAPPPAPATASAAGSVAAPAACACKHGMTLSMAATWIRCDLPDSMEKHCLTQTNR